MYELMTRRSFHHPINPFYIFDASQILTFKIRTRMIQAVWLRPQTTPLSPQVPLSTWWSRAVKDWFLFSSSFPWDTSFPRVSPLSFSGNSKLPQIRAFGLGVFPVLSGVTPRTTWEINILNKLYFRGRIPVSVSPSVNHPSFRASVISQE